MPLDRHETFDWCHVGTSERPHFFRFNGVTMHQGYLAVKAEFFRVPLIDTALFDDLNARIEQDSRKGLFVPEHQSFQSLEPIKSHPRVFATQEKPVQHF